MKRSAEFLETELQKPGPLVVTPFIKVELVDLVKKRAAEQGVSASQVIRDAICHYLDIDVRRWERARLAAAADAVVRETGSYTTRRGRPAARRVA